MAKQSAPRQLTQPETLREKFEQLVNEPNLDGLLALYAPDATVIRRNGSLAVGKDAIRTHLSRILAQKPSFRSRVLKTVTVGDTAIMISEWRLDGTARDGAPIRVRARSCDVVRRHADGRWLILIDDPYGSLGGARPQANGEG
jgi:uncharacterized protein (TIGR02246 family)